MRNHSSLKQRLLALVLMTVVLVWVGATAFTYVDAREEFDEVLDAHLAQSASLLIVQVSQDLEGIETEHAPLLHKYSRHVAFQIWENGQVLHLHSANAPSHPLADREQGFSDTVINGKSWRVFSTWDEAKKTLIQVAMSSMAERKRSRSWWCTMRKQKNLKCFRVPKSYLAAIS